MELKDKSIRGPVPDSNSQVTGILETTGWKETKIRPISHTKGLTNNGDKKGLRLS